MAIDYNNVCASIDQARTILQTGRVSRVIGLTVESEGPVVSIGDLCHIESPDSGDRIEAEVVGFKESRLLLMPLGDLRGITSGAIVISTGDQLRIPVGDELIGRVVDGLGKPIDGKGPLMALHMRGVNAIAPQPLSRPPIQKALYTGIKSIDMTCTCGEGQRIGIFAGSGVGKSVTLGMMARNSTADINVIALIGERGREVQEFILDALGESGLRRSVVVAVTSDQAPLLRLKGAMVATTIAEHFRDQGKNVLLMMDSLTRVAMAQREIGLAIGEPPATKGYTPSVYTLLPRLLERAGTTEKGSITGFYTVLVEGDDMNEPISDLSRSILDGHITLSRRLAARNQYPAVDILQSISRLMTRVADSELRELAGAVREIYAVYSEAEDLINVGAYTAGSSPKIDRAISAIDKLNTFFKQGIEERGTYEEVIHELKEIIEDSHVTQENKANTANPKMTTTSPKSSEMSRKNNEEVLVSS